MKSFKNFPRACSLLLVRYVEIICVYIGVYRDMLKEPEPGVSGAWNLYDSTEWAPCPIGCLPGGVMPCLDLNE